MIWTEGDSGNITVTVAEQGALLADLDRRFAAGQGFSVATLNLDHVVKLARDTDFQRAYGSQTHITADGNPIVWISRLAGQYVNLVPGSELIHVLTEVAARRGVSIALFGSDDTTLKAARENLHQHHPDARIVLCRAPAMEFDPLSAAAQGDIAAIGASGARLCFLALGAPKQEIFAARAQNSLPQVGFVSIGAGLDFIAGTQRRAPAWVRAIAAEWLWRLLSDPRRLAARYGACFRILPGLVRKALRARSRQTVRQ